LVWFTTKIKIANGNDTDIFIKLNFVWKGSQNYNPKRNGWVVETTTDFIKMWHTQKFHWRICIQHGNVQVHTDMQICLFSFHSLIVFTVCNLSFINNFCDNSKKPTRPGPLNNPCKYCCPTACLFSIPYI